MTVQIDNVRLHHHDHLLSVAVERGLGVATYEGALNDTYLIFADGANLSKAIGSAKYVVCYHKYLNPFNNTLHIVASDDWDDIIESVPWLDEASVDDRAEYDMTV